MNAKSNLESRLPSVAELPNLVVTSEDYASCDCVTVQTLCSHLAADHTVILLSNTAPLLHFASISTKLSFNLRKYSTDGRLLVFEGLNLMKQAALLDEKESSEHPYCFVDGVKSMNPLFAMLKAAIDQVIESNKKFVVIIDSLTSFLNFGVPTSELEKFSLKLLDAVSRKQTGALVMTVRADGDEESSHLLDVLLRLMDHHIALRGLDTGRCRDVDAVLSVAARGAKTSSHYHLRLSERSVEVFAPGMARA